MVDQIADREGRGSVKPPRRVLRKFWVAPLAFGLAIALLLMNVLHTPRSHDYEGLVLMIASFFMIPFWIACGCLAVLGAVRTAFWLTIVPILLVFVACVLASVFG